MKIHQEVYLKSKTLSDDDFIRTFRQFGQQVNGWTFLEKQSEDYISGVGESSCILLMNDGKIHPSVAITKKGDGIYYVANIVPRKTGRIPLLEYNAFAKRFARDFRKFVRANKTGISVSLPSEDANLKDIISSTKAREFFERYLNAYPTSYHPSDIKRLDVFICAASKYCRRPVDVDRLERYLVEDLRWSLENAKWCRDRIETGLDILAVKKRF